MGHCSYTSAAYTLLIPCEELVGMVTLILPVQVPTPSHSYSAPCPEVGEGLAWVAQGTQMT
jgi:hypothetical protein